MAEVNAFETPSAPSSSGWGRERFLERLRWLFARPSIAVAILVNLIFLFLPFYDSNNIPLALSIGSHFTSAVPASHYNGWVAGVFVYAMFVPGYLSYLAGGFQLYWVYTAFKAIYFVLAVWMAYALYLAARPRGDRVAVAVAVFVLANPIWIMTSYIWVEYDILPVAFLAVGYLLLRARDPRKTDQANLLLAVGLIAVSVFFYWFAAALIPSFLYYSRTRRERVALFGALVGVLGTLFAVSVALFANGALLYTQSIVGSNTTLSRASFFGLQYFQPLSLPVYLGLVAALALLLPILLKRLGFTEVATAFVVLTLFIFTSPIPMPDNYVVAFPFAVLAFLEFRRRDLKFRWLWGLLAFPAAGLLLVNLYVSNAQPDGVGVFFFGYDLFHANIHFLQSVGGAATFLRAYNIALVAAIALSLGILTRKRPRETGPRVPSLPSSTGWPDPAWRGSRRSVMTTTIAVLGILAVLSLVFNNVTPNLVDYRGAGPAPIYLMIPGFIPGNGNVVRPLPDGTFSASGNTVVIASSAPPLGFGRWFAPEGVQIGGGVSFSGAIPREAIAVNASPFQLSILNLSYPGLARASLVPVDEVHELAPATMVGQGAPGEMKTVRQYSDTSFSEYTLNATAWRDRYFAFSVLPVDGAAVPTILFSLEGSQGSLAIARDANGTGLTCFARVTGAPPEAMVIPDVVPLHRWSFVVLHLTGNGIDLNIDGSTRTLPEPFYPNGTVDLMLGHSSVGVPPLGSFRGYATGLYRATSAYSTLPAFGYTVRTNTSWTNGTLPGPAVEFAISSTLSNTTFTVAGRALSAPNQTSQFSWGKFGAGAYAVTLVLDRLTMTQLEPNRYYLVPVFWAAISPFVLVAVSLPRLRALARSSRTDDEASDSPASPGTR